MNLAYSPPAAQPHFTPRASAARGIPSLDGLRALSIGLVLLSHGTWSRGTRAVVLGTLGVRTFFVISGFLITSLLLRELDHRGAISLRRFYLRRTLRIFPAYYIFLGVAAIAPALGWFGIAGARYWPALTYTSNLFATHSWTIGHTWSLSVEEQFYLCWPFAVATFGRRRGLRIAIGALVVVPVIRCMFVLFGLGGEKASTFNFDFLAAGCCLALCWSRIAAAPLWHRRGTGLVMLAATLSIVTLHLVTEQQLRWLFAANLSVVQPLEALTLALIIAWCVRCPYTMVGRLLNTRPFRAVGVLSYSVYLWQQVFLGNDALSPFLAVLLTFGVATASYWLVERPGFVLREALSRRRYADQTDPTFPALS